MSIELIEARQARQRARVLNLEAINENLRPLGYRVVYNRSTRTGGRSLRPYALLGPAGAEKTVGRYEFAEKAYDKAMRLLGAAR